MTPTAVNPELYQSEVVTTDLIDDYTSLTGPTSYIERIKDGQSLEWQVAKFTIGKKSETTEKVFLAWCKDGKPVSPVDTKRTPSVDIELPPGPIKAFYISPDSILKYAEDVGRANQKVEFHHTGYDASLYADWDAAVNDLNAVFVEKLAKFLVENVDRHSLLNDSDRAVIEDEGKEEAVKVLTRIMKNSHDHSHHLLRWWVPKRNIFQQNYSDGPIKKICPFDEWVTDREDWQRIADHMTKSVNPLKLNLVRILLPDGKSVVHPDDYNRLYSEGAAGAMTLTIYGIYKRPDGQHTTMAANTCVQLLTNGTPSMGGAAGVDLYAIRQAKRKRELELEDEAKRACDESTY